MSLTWKTSDGRMIPVADLEDSHLKNIIKDGYRHPDLVSESLKRGFDVPERKVDLLSLSDIMLWVESFASCALSGNKFAQYMTDTYNKSTDTFLFLLNRYLVQLEEEACANNDYINTLKN